MKNGACPKCGSDEIIRVRGVSSIYTGMANIVTPAYVTRFICGLCGFCEEWIEDSEDIQKLKEKYRARRFQVKKSTLNE